ncbi:hypothetical protein [Methylovorus glucosotrophus]|uniref:hypothetical protein n=1 Tax=Methylovorus glucosotrophus TaxID=266009 RepID=UPI00147814E0|nr:hypothetical protein [Methylovorus glucosotrophus]
MKNEELALYTQSKPKQIQNGVATKNSGKKMGLQVQARNIVGGVSNNREETPY